MSIRTRIAEAVSLLLRNYLGHRGYQIVENRLLYEWQRNRHVRQSYNASSQLPETAVAYLLQDNPVLLNLQERYSKFNTEVTDPLLWKKELVGPREMQYFRGDNAYVWQLRGPNMNELGYVLTTYYVKSIDTLGLMNTQKEDDLFGNFTFTVDNKTVSRDLLDSIIEIHFLERHLKISSRRNLRILDIGAGYGRLAHRMVSALPNITKYYCADAVPVSTFISEFYVRFRNLEEKVKVIPLDQIEESLQGGTADIAINVHSFSECRIPAIEWWLSALEKGGVRYLMIVPNSGDHGGQYLRTIDGKDFGAAIEDRGYKLVAKEPKYSDQLVQKYAINPTCFHLFERR